MKEHAAEFWAVTAGALTLFNGMLMSANSFDDIYGFVHSLQAPLLGDENITHIASLSETVLLTTVSTLVVSMGMVEATYGLLAPRKK